MSYRHAAVWLDSKEAHVFRLRAGRFAESVISCPEHLPTSSDEVDERLFFSRVMKRLVGVRGFFIAGPSTEKDRFRRYIVEHDASSRHVVEQAALASSWTSVDFEQRMRDYLTTADAASGGPTTAATGPSYRCG